MSSRDPYLSFVVPVYGSPESLGPLCERVRGVCARLGQTYEMILVDDRCPRGSWPILQQLSRTDPAIVALRLSRNFGQHAAIQAGLIRCRGEWVVVMDCDLQDRPEEVPELLNKAQEGYDVVLARRSKRSDVWYRRIISRTFYAVLSFLTDTHQSSEVANFGIYHRKVIGAINVWHEETKYFPAIVQWVGFSQASIDVEHGARFVGHSSYTLRKLIRLALTVIIGFSDRPLKLVTLLGFVIAAGAFAVAFLVVVAHLSGWTDVEGWTSVVLSLWFLAGCLLWAVGLIGLYVGRILTEAKGRPTFIIDEILHVAPATTSNRQTQNSIAAGDY